MRLYLLRHAEADSQRPDERRALTVRGRHDVTTLGRELQNEPTFEPCQIWHSPYTRAVETAQLLAAELNFAGPIEAGDGLTPEDPCQAWVEICNRLEESVLIVGHNPFLSYLAGRFIGETAIHFRKCALACLARERSEDLRVPPRWKLGWMREPPLFQ